MKNFKKALLGAMAFAMMMPMVATSVNAADSLPTDDEYNSTADVTFDDVIPDPGNPTDPTWGVKIPTSVKLNSKSDSEATGKDISVSIVAVSGGEVTDAKVVVSVKSENAYMLKDATPTNPAKDLKYAIKYVGGTELNNTTPGAAAADVATFENAGTTPANGTVVGKAYLKSTAVKAGDYKDTLTFVVKTPTI